ncbi:hypothetical protein [Noviherbaspirillum saxi]|uniref:Uncharacterized protein n=1 Tax=Noviherbaspirillum saxi TaxID=2320863 RepID=A0A3A3FYH3_9BURK|nr:hypothetical protein [Noviherbaspirillum saxi]RJF92139.1 hypothetical protein D3871_26210 [Noviherbaspirillum saxi]
MISGSVSQSLQPLPPVTVQLLEPDAAGVRSGFSLAASSIERPLSRASMLSMRSWSDAQSNVVPKVFHWSWAGKQISEDHVLNIVQALIHNPEMRGVIWTDSKHSTIRVIESLCDGLNAEIFLRRNVSYRKAKEILALPKHGPLRARPRLEIRSLDMEDLFSPLQDDQSFKDRLDTVFESINQTDIVWSLKAQAGSGEFRGTITPDIVMRVILEERSGHSVFANDAASSDVSRLLILALHPGTYMDCDIRTKAALPDNYSAAQGLRLFYAEDSHGNTVISNNILSAPAYSLTVVELIAHAICNHLYPDHFEKVLQEKLDDLICSGASNLHQFQHDEYSKKAEEAEEALRNAVQLRAGLRFRKSAIRELDTMLAKENSDFTQFKDIYPKTLDALQRKRFVTTPIYQGLGPQNLRALGTMLATGPSMYAKCLMTIAGAPYFYIYYNQEDMGIPLDCFEQPDAPGSWAKSRSTSVSTLRRLSYHGCQSEQRKT